MGVDEFLGRVIIPLNELDVYERPKNKWFVLQSKAGKYFGISSCWVIYSE